jgi:hypothetical protein
MYCSGSSASVGSITTFASLAENLENAVNCSSNMLFNLQVHSLSTAFYDHDIAVLLPSTYIEKRSFKNGICMSIRLRVSVVAMQLTT